MSQYIWTKMKGFSTWPSKTCQIVPQNIKRPNKSKDLVCVYFFGTCNYAWVSTKNICNYSENKEKFSSKNKTPIFKKAIEEIEGALKEEGAHESVLIAENKITLKNFDIDELISTFDEHELILRTIFNQRRSEVDRFIHGNGYDFLTVLSRTLTSSQQHAMYWHICEKFIGDKEKYLRSLKHENLIWTILLPEWSIGICVTRYQKSGKEEVIEQIKRDEEHSFNADDSLEL